jgi:hypothetical protein
MRVKDMGLGAIFEKQIQLDQLHGPYRMLDAYRATSLVDSLSPKHQLIAATPKIAALGTIDGLSSAASAFTRDLARRESLGNTLSASVAMRMHEMSPSLAIDRLSVAGAWFDDQKRLANLVGPKFRGVLEMESIANACTTLSAIYENPLAAPIGLLGGCDAVDARADVASTFSWLSRSGMTGERDGQVASAVWRRSAAGSARQTIVIKCAVECFGCGAHLMVADEKLLSVSEHVIDVKLIVVPYCGACRIKNRENPSAIRDQLNELAVRKRPPLPQLVHDGPGDEGDGIARASLMLVRRDEDV